MFKVVAVDNLARESIADRLIHENILSKTEAQAIADQLNAETKVGDGPGSFYVVKPQS